MRRRNQGSGIRGQGVAWLVVLLLSTCLSQPNHSLAAPLIRPLFWADGITQLDHLDNYARAGFNTVVVRLYWQPSPDGSIIATDLAPQRAFALAAAQRGLNVIYALPPAPAGKEREFHIAGDSKPYRLLWSNWVQSVVNDLRGSPNLLGWMLPDDPRGLPFSSGRGFARWIAANYGSVEVLNRQWHTAYSSLDEASLSNARRLVAQWHGTAPPAKRDISEYLQQAQRRPANQNFAFHPIELAIAHYEWDAYRALLDFWAQTVRAADSPRQVFAGRLPDYAQLLSLPPSIDVSVPAVSPLWAEKDIATHNPQAVAVARRGGRFAAIPVLSTSLPGAPDDLLPRLMPSWCDAALAQGARGLAFDSWLDIAQNPDLRRAIRNTLRRLQNEEYSVLWGQSPQASAAIVLTPLADGHTWRAPAPAPAAALPPLAAGQTAAAPPPRGLFGFGEDMVPGEPSDLVYALRWGTLFGAVDYLSPDELGGSYSASAGGVLKRYGAVLMPQALSVSPAMAQDLAGYIAGGGAVVADIGLGAAQNGGQVLGLPESLAAIFGVVPVQLQTTAFNVKVVTPHPLFPSWSVGAATPNDDTGGDGYKGAAFVGPTLLTELTPGTLPLALGIQVPRRMGPPPAPGAPDDASRVRMLRSWLSLRPFGAGAAVFAPFRLWNFWRPGYVGFDAFHGDLLARGAQLSHLGATALVPAPPGTAEGAALYPAAVNFPNAIALINTGAAPGAPYAQYNTQNNAPRRNETDPAPAPEDGATTPDAAAITPTRARRPAGKDNSIADKSIASGSARVQLVSSLDVASPLAAPNPQPIELIPTIAPLPAVVQTAGVEQFLWSDAICVFPIGAAPPSTPGRRPPVEGFNEVGAGEARFIVPAATQPVLLHTLVPAQEMKVLRLLPIRIINPGGGPMACRVRSYTSQKIELRIWPNTQTAQLGPTEWRVSPGAEGLARLSVFDTGQEGSYRIGPGSKHVVAITEISSDGKNKVAATRNYVVLADAEGALPFEIRGASLRIEITPYGLAPPSTPASPPDATPGPGATPPTPRSPAIMPEVTDEAPPPSPPATAPKAREKEDEPEIKIGSDGAPVFHKRYNR